MPVAEGEDPLEPEEPLGEVAEAEAAEPDPDAVAEAEALVVLSVPVPFNLIASR